MPMTKEERLDYCHRWIKRIQSDESSLNTDREDAKRFYRADDDIVPWKRNDGIEENVSKATTTDLMDTIEWIKPQLLEIFAGSNEVINLEPTSEEDVEPVKQQQILVRYQARIKNKWFTLWHDFLDDMFKLKTGVLKYQWLKKTDYVKKELGADGGLNDYEYGAVLLTPSIEILEHKEFYIETESGVERRHYLKINKPVYDEYVLIEAVPAEDFGFPYKSTRTIENTPFCFHRVRKTKQELIAEYGKKKFAEIEVCGTHPENDSSEAVRIERFRDLGGVDFYYTTDTEEYIIYEAYYTDPDSGERVIHVFCGDVEFDYRENEYKTPPFIVVSPIRQAHRVCGYGFYDLLREIQMIRTHILRQFINHISHGNNKRIFYDRSGIVDLEAFNDNSPGVKIPTNRDPNNVVKEETKAPISPEVYSLWEMMKEEKDYHSGVPRSFQGVNPKILNATWRGQNQQVQQASQRVMMISRLIAELALKPLVEAMVNLNIDNLSQPVAFRYLNEFVRIERDNIVGKFDVSVNIGLGNTDKLERIANLQQLLALQKQAIEMEALAGIPDDQRIVNRQNVYYTLSELVQTMGFKNVKDFVTRPTQNMALPIDQMGNTEKPQMENQDLAAMFGKIQPAQPANTFNPITPATEIYI